MNTFKTELKQELIQSQGNNFGRENFDEHRFGEMVKNKRSPTNLLYQVKQVVKKVIRYKKMAQQENIDTSVENKLVEVKRYESDLEYLFQNVNPACRELLIKLIAYRVLGYTKVKLPFNNQKYWESLELVKTLKDGTEKYDPHFMHFILEKFDLSPIGYNIKMFFSEVGIAIDFVAEQYAYKIDDSVIVQAERNDIILDIGGCWGDTALYFADKVGSSGRVYSFEFIPDNMKLHKINCSLNSVLKERIELVPKPVSDISGIPIFFLDNGPGSKIELRAFEGQTGSATTISIDDFIEQNEIKKVDFIKMDIEGAEQAALRGALETIKKFRPKLAIAIYHSMEDFINIPRWILSLNLGYELYIGHYTIHAEETICFAKSITK